MVALLMFSIVHIKIELKESYNSKFHVNRFLLLCLLEIDLYNVFKFSFDSLVLFVLLLLMFDVYICAGMKELEWLH